MNIRTDVETQARWLMEHDPDYLISHPSNIKALLHCCLESNIQLTNLGQVRTFGEIVNPELRALSRQIWVATVIDAYSAEEIGYIALQCPDHEHYHVQAENLLVEMLGDGGKPCGEGQTGRVVVTTLHNHAVPLIRYAISDYATAGPSCPCGRGLPVLSHIHGRQRNLAVLPDGKRFFHSFPAKTWSHLAPIQQIQLIQKSPTTIQARLVVARLLTHEEQGKLSAALAESLQFPFKFYYEYVQEIPRTRNNKYEDFISEIA